ncbi:MAG: glycoside hydrolase family 2 TIM barrel-domain containing protein [Bacteroidales bacterium]|nr:glycoside hydrolase family 2 TIM barrel-domain containing protein [Bacteroidales bacterium]
MKKIFSLVLGILLLLNTSSLQVQAARIEMPLNNDWSFRLNYQASKGSERRVDLPHTWNAQDAFSGKSDYYRGVGNYEKKILIPSEWKGKRLFIRFEGANTVTDFFVNAKHVGEHRGGYTAFIFEVTPFVEYGKENIFLARVNNALMLDVMPLVGDFNFYGGIYRDVQLLVTEPICISPLDYASSGISLLQKKVSKEMAEIEVQTMVSNADIQSRNIDLRVDVLDDKGNNVLSKTESVVIPSGVSAYPVPMELLMKQPHLWNGTKDPYLYNVVVSLEENGTVIDQLRQPLGLRFYSVDPEKGFYLNGEPYRLKGICRHQDRNEVGNALRPFHHEEDVAIIREIGANAVRLSHYPQATYLLNLLDHYGIIAWSEIPFVGPGGYLDRGFVDSESFRENGKLQLKEMIKQHFNHPSICFWGLYNELKMEGDNPTEYLKELNAIAHRYDPSRLTTAASFQDGEINEITDLIAWNKYFGWYGGPPSGMAKWADETHAAFPGLKMAVSEYGAGGSILHQQDTLVPSVPVSWWHPENWQTYYHIENWKILKARPYLWGTFIWAMFDFGSSIRTEGDTYGRNDKGLVTMDRKIKKDAFYFYKANWNEEPMIHIAEKKNLNRSASEIKVTVFSNLKEVELLVNGKSLGKKRPDEVSVITWENVRLAVGENKIEAVSTDRKKSYNDSCVWYYK